MKLVLESKTGPPTTICHTDWEEYIEKFLKGGWGISPHETKWKGRAKVAYLTECKTIKWDTSIIIIIALFDKILGEIGGWIENINYK